MTANPYTLSFLNISFINVIYLREGYLIELAHQLSLPVTIANLTFIGVVSGSINVESSNTKFQAFKTMVNIQGMITNTVFEQSQPFFRVQKDAVVDITLTSFSNVESLYLESGIFSTESNSILTIQDAIFQNNSGISATLFKVKDFSSLQ